MSKNTFNHAQHSTIHLIYKRFLVKSLRTIFLCLISLLFVQLPTLCHFIIRLGGKDERIEKQKSVRAKLTDESDPLSPYRAVEALDKLQTQVEKKVETLAAVPDWCLKRHGDKETMGVREILDVEEEKQPNGKVFKKVFVISIRK